MNRQLTTDDAPKIALVLGLLLALCGAGWFTMHKITRDREIDRMGQQMDREASLPEMVNIRQPETTEADTNDPEKQLLIRH